MQNEGRKGQNNAQTPNQYQHEHVPRDIPSTAEATVRHMSRKCGRFARHTTNLISPFTFFCKAATSGLHLSKCPSGMQMTPQGIFRGLVHEKGRNL